jgi:hypothetical protein
MPLMHDVIHRGNLSFMPWLIDEFDLGPADGLPDGHTFAEAIEALELTTSGATLEFIRTWPPGQLAAVGAAIRHALGQAPRMGITLAWAPAYDFEVTIWESEGMDETMRGEMTIMFKSPYPAGHPAIARMAQMDAKRGAVGRKASKVAAKKASSARKASGGGRRR